MYTILIEEIEVQPTPVTPNERSFGVDVRIEQIHFTPGCGHWEDWPPISRTGSRIAGRYFSVAVTLEVPPVIGTDV